MRRESNLSGADSTAGVRPAEANAEAIAPRISQSLELLMDRLSARNLAIHVDRPISLVPFAQGFKSTACKSTKGFMTVITTHYAALLRSVGASEATPDSPAVCQDAVALLERAFNPDGGFSFAFDNARAGIHGGLLNVLNTMTEQFRQETRRKYAERVYREIAGPLGWQDRFALVRAFLANAGPALPSDIRSQSPKRLAKNFNVLLDAYVGAIDKVRALVRTL